MSAQTDASAEQITLCEHYARALNSFQQEQWDIAVTQLGDILQQYPDDGPSQFLLKRITQYQNGSATPGDAGLIRMDVK